MKSQQHDLRRASRAAFADLSQQGSRNQGLSLSTSRAGLKALTTAFAASLSLFAHAAEGDNVVLRIPKADQFWLYIALIFGFIAIAFSGVLVKQIQKLPVGDKMRRIGRFIEDGARAYLVQQIRMMALFIGVLAIGLFALYKQQGTEVAIGVAVCFVLGVLASYVSGSLGMLIAVRSNMRVATAALTSNRAALECAFKAGAVSGLITVGIGLIGSTGILIFGAAKATTLLVGFGFGASLSALFMRVGGGIYTKAADVGADLVGKVEAGIPEDDPRNPAVIADNVGDNVGDCAGMAADVFESFEVTLVASIILGAATASVLDSNTWPKLILFALMVAATGLMASIVGIILVKGSDDLESDPLKPILGGFRVGAVLAAAGSFVLAFLMMNNIKSYEVVPLTKYSYDEAQAIREIRDRQANALNKKPFEITPKQIREDQRFKDLRMEPEDMNQPGAENALESEIREMIGLDFARFKAPDAIKDYEVVLPSDVDANTIPALTYATVKSDEMGGGASEFVSMKDRYFTTGSDKYVVVRFQVDTKIPAQKDPKGKEISPARAESQKVWVGPISAKVLDEQLKRVTENAKNVGGEFKATKLAEAPVEFFYNRKEDMFMMAIEDRSLEPGVDKANVLSRPHRLPDVSQFIATKQFFRAEPSEMKKYAEDRQKDPTATAGPQPVNMGIATFRTQIVPWWAFGCAVTFGIVLAIVIEMLTNYYVSATKKPVQEVAGVATAGPAPMIIQGFAYGAESSVFMTLAIVGGLLLPLYLFPAAIFGSQILGFYGVALVGLGLLTTTGYILAMDTFGPISDNAQGVYEMSGEGKENEYGATSLQRLDAAGNTTKALTKGFAIATAVVAAVALFHSFVESAKLESFGLRLDVPEIFLGLLIGAAAPFLFSAFAINAVGRSAFDLIQEVRRQFRAKPGILEGTEEPDYGACVEIVTKAAQKELLGPGILAICLPIAVAFGFSIGKAPVAIGNGYYNLAGAQALGGFLAGAIASGQLMAVLLSNSGGMWDNAKKVIEDGMFGGKGTEAHKASVVCDTVGDPFKDTAGPALNPLIKVMNLVGLLLAGVVIQPMPIAASVGVTLLSVALLAFAVYKAKQGSLSESLQHAGDDV